MSNARDFANKLRKVNQWMHSGAPCRIAGIEAVKHTEKAFKEEAFSDRSEKDQPWEDVKRRTHPKGDRRRSDARRKILHGRPPELAEATRYEIKGLSVFIKNEKVYAPTHNYGLKAGRMAARFIMPKRKFIGHSAIMTKRILDKIIDKHNKLLAK